MDSYRSPSLLINSSIQFSPISLLNGSPSLGQLTWTYDSQKKITDFAIPANNWVRLKESEKRDKYQDFAGELKTMEHKIDGDTNCNRCARHSDQRTGKGTGRIENHNMSGDHTNDSTVKIIQNTEKNPGDLWRLAVSQTRVKDHQLMLVWKTLKGE